MKHADVIALCGDWDFAYTGDLTESEPRMSRDDSFDARMSVPAGVPERVFSLIPCLNMCDVAVKKGAVQQRLLWYRVLEALL